MRKTLIISLMFAPLLVFAAASSQDKMDIQGQVTAIEEAVNSGDGQAIINLTSPNASAELKSAIEDAISGKQIRFQEDITSYDEISADKVKVNGRFSAEATNWSISGLSNYFVFERVDGQWLLVDTDFHQKLGPGTVLKIIGTAFAIILPIFIILGAFWLWMLIDCIVRPVDNKTTWLLVIIFLQFLGAVLYFFIARRKAKKIQQDGSQNIPPNIPLNISQ
jgi:hypothetical protein